MRGGELSGGIKFKEAFTAFTNNQLLANMVGNLPSSVIAEASTTSSMKFEFLFFSANPLIIHNWGILMNGLSQAFRYLIYKANGIVGYRVTANCQDPVQLSLPCGVLPSG